MKPKYPSIKEAVSQIMQEVLAEGQIKTAERQILKGALNPRFSTNIGHYFMKLGEQCRNLADNPEASYDDLRNFVEQVNAK